MRGWKVEKVLWYEKQLVGAIANPVSQFDHIFETYEILEASDTSLIYIKVSLNT